MREIKFRGKRIDNGEWLYGGYYHDDCYGNKDNEKHYITIWNSFGLGFIQNVEVIPETIGQYIGLKDKYGEELYENDIIENEYKERWLIVWDGTGFRVALEGSKKHIYAPNEYWFESCRKIGNIFDNPELLHIS